MVQGVELSRGADPCRRGPCLRLPRLHNLAKNQARSRPSRLRRDQRNLLRLPEDQPRPLRDRKSTRLNSSHLGISYAVFCLKKKHPRFGAPVDHAACALLAGRPHLLQAETTGGEGAVGTVRATRALLNYFVSKSLLPNRHRPFAPSLPQRPTLKS